MNYRKPILVTGTHRSGSTWVGKMISFSPDVGYIHEPFNPNHRRGVLDIRWDYWFKSVRPEETEKYLPAFEKMLTFQYDLMKDLLRTESFNPKYIHYRLQDKKRFAQYRKDNVRPLIKDPLAFFSTEWLAKTFDMDVIITIRHPAAFASSLVRLEWDIDFREFLKQPHLMDSDLQPYKDQIFDFTNNHYSRIEQACLYWNIVYSIVLRWMKNHDNWLFVTHESLSADYLNGFRQIYKYLNLEYSEDVARKIDLYCNADNKDFEVKKVTEKHKLNSAKNIKSWKKRLSDDQVKIIRETTCEIADQFYGEEYWE